MPEVIIPFVEEIVFQTNRPGFEVWLKIVFLTDLNCKWQNTIIGYSNYQWGTFPAWG